MSRNIQEIPSSASTMQRIDGYDVLSAGTVVLIANLMHWQTSIALFIYYNCDHWSLIVLLTMPTAVVFST